MRRFFLTRAGAEATNLLASYHLDRGRPALALFYLNRLLKSSTHQTEVSDAVRAKRAVALAMLDRKEDAHKAFEGIGGDRLQLGGSLWPVTKVFDAIPRATELNAPSADWPLLGGNARRSTVAPPGLPLLFPDWSMPLLSGGRSDLSYIIDGIVDWNRSQRRPMDFGFFPVIHGQTVYYRNMQRTMAIELASGRVLWQTKRESNLETEFDKSHPRFFPASVAQPGVQSTFLSNSIYGSLSTDGERLYQIDQLVLNPNPFQVRTRNDDDDTSSSRLRNRLTALDVKTGEIAWHVGGEAEKDAAPPRLPDTFFLSPPLPIDGRLYVLGENRAEIKLHCLDSRDGSPLWSQVIALCQRPIDADLFRRTQACFLAYQEGILICPTNLYRVVAVDPLTRTVLWHYVHAESDGRQVQQFAPMQFIQAPNNAAATDPPIIERGRVMITAAQGNILHCVDLQSGRPLWRVAREGTHHVAGVFGDRVLLVGSDQVRSIRWENGTVEWKQKVPLPSGRGICNGKQFLLPLADGGIAVLDVENGAVGSLMMSRSRQPMGNLLAANGRVIACGYAGAESYPLVDDVRRDVESRLAKDPGDPLGRFRRAELLLSEGKILDAIADLQQALAAKQGSDATKRARDLMFDIAANEAIAQPKSVGTFVQELGKLAATADEKGIHLRLLAEQKLANGDFLGTLEAIDKHGALGLSAPVASEQGQVVRHPRTWSRSMARRLLASASPGARAELDRALGARLESLTQQKDIVGLELLASTFAGQAIGDRAYANLGDRLSAMGRWGEAENAYLSVTGSGDGASAAHSLAALASIAEAAKQSGDALVYYEQLAAQYGDKPVRASLTGKGLRDAFLADDKRSGAAKMRGADWPFESMAVSFGKNPRMDNNRRVIFPTKDELPYFSDRLFMLNQQASSIECYRGGSESREWHTVLTAAQNTMGPVRCDTLGHVLFFPIGEMVHGVSALDQKVLWSRRFSGAVGVPLQISSSARFTTPMDGANSIPLVGRGFVAVNTGKDLVLVEPWTGRDLWIRKNLEPGQFIFGDEEYLFLVSRDASYSVYRTLDGELLRKARFGATFQSHKFLVGRKALVFRGEGKQQMLRLWDPWTNTNEWSLGFPAGTRFFPTDTSEAILLGPDGALAVVDAKTGKKVLDDQLGSEAGVVQGIFSFRDARRHYLSIEKRMPGRNPWPIAGMPNTATRVVNGSLRAYDQESKKLLWNRDLAGMSAIVRPGAELPVILCTGFRMVEKTKDQRQLAMNIEVLDKRNGKTLHREERDDYNPISELAYDLEGRWIELRSWNFRMRLDFVPTSGEKGEKQ
ncbi:MAG: PQQ-binding-like beta-propeller repeat protein [Planctomycetota bacterium]